MKISDIKSPADFRGHDIDELKDLCTQLREVFLQKLSAHGGHVGPNLGMVEATLALHYVFDTPMGRKTKRAQC